MFSWMAKFSRCGGAKSIRNRGSKFNAAVMQVPCTKGDIFKSKTITVQEKRQLMKLITALTKPEDAEKAELEAAAETPFVDFLKARGLSQNLQTFIMYSIAMIGPDQRAEDAQKLPTSAGLERMLRFLRSLGRYGNTPLIYPLFGMSDINQAFTRFAAVYGAVYVLGQAPSRLLIDKSDTSTSAAGKVVGTVIAARQVLKSPFVVASMDHIPTFVADEESTFMSRLTCCIDKTIDPDGKDVLLFAGIPPHSSAEFDIPDTVYILQLDPSTSCCPAGKLLVHMWTQGSASSTSSLKTIAQKLFRNDASIESDSRPLIEWMSVFEQRIRNPISADKIPQGLVVVPDVEQSIDPDTSFQVAKKMFQEMYPGEEFIPEVPHPDDVKWGVDDEEQEATPSESTQPVVETEPASSSTAPESADPDEMPSLSSFD
jgi:Rab proteins geranylgeranyltransferase component A